MNNETTKTDFERSLDLAKHIGSMTAVVRAALLKDFSKPVCAQAFVDIVERDGCTIPNIVELANNLKEKYNL